MELGRPSRSVSADRVKGNVFRMLDDHVIAVFQIQCKLLERHLPEQALYFRLNDFDAHRKSPPFDVLIIF